MLLFLRQLTTSAEIEEVWGLPCGALDLELDAVEDAAREMHSTLRTKWLMSCTLSSTSDRYQACQHGIRSRRRAVTDWRWALYLISLTPSGHEMKQEKRNLPSPRGHRPALDSVFLLLTPTDHE